MVHSNLVIRHYSEEDLPAILEWYHSATNPAPQFVQDEHFLKHLILHPNVKEDGIFVVKDNGEIVGFAVVSVTERGDITQGNILEFRAQDASSLELLNKAAEYYCMQNNADVIIAIPLVVTDNHKVLNDWIKFDRTVMMCKLLSILPLLDALMDTVKIRNYFAGKDILFIIDDLVIQVQISNTSLHFTQLDSVPEQSMIQVAITSEAFLDIIFGMSNLYLAYIVGKVCIKGFRNVLPALKLLRAMKRNMPWSISIRDCT